MQLRLLNVPVDGGDLRVLLWGTGKRVAVAVHGITASGMSWQAVARHMPSDWTLAAPDLRGRGHSRDLPGPVRPGQARQRRGGGAAPFRRTAGACRAFDGRVRRAARPRRAPGTRAPARPGRRRAAAAGAGGHRPGGRARCDPGPGGRPAGADLPGHRGVPGFLAGPPGAGRPLDRRRRGVRPLRPDRRARAAALAVSSGRRSAPTAARCWRRSRSRTRSAG